MFKKIITAVVSIAMLSTIICMPVSAETFDVYEGDTVQYIFSLGQSDNVAGVAVDSWYNADYLTPVDGELIGVSGYVNTSYAVGAMKWNFIVYGGRAFDNEDVAVITFDATKSGYLSDLGLSYDCVECFNHSMNDVADNFNEFVTARTIVNHTGNHYDKYFLLGDIDGDEEVTSNDAVMALRYSVGSVNYDDRLLKVADIDGDEEITSNDAIMILRISIGA